MRKRLEAASMRITAETVRRDREGYSLTVEMNLDQSSAENLLTVRRNIRL